MNRSTDGAEGVGKLGLSVSVDLGVNLGHVFIVKAKGTMKCLSVALDQAEAPRSPAFLTYHKEAKCPQLI